MAVFVRGSSHLQATTATIVAVGVDSLPECRAPCTKVLQMGGRPDCSLMGKESFFASSENAKHAAQRLL